MINAVYGDILNTDADWLVLPMAADGALEEEHAFWLEHHAPEALLACTGLGKDVDIFGKALSINYEDHDGGVIYAVIRHHRREKARIEDVSSTLQKVAFALKGVQARSVALPLLGVGERAGGLDWTRVLPLTRNRMRDLPTAISIFLPKELKFGEDDLRVEQALYGHHDIETALVMRTFRQTGIIADRAVANHVLTDCLLEQRAFPDPLVEFIAELGLGTNRRIETPQQCLALLNEYHRLGFVSAAQLQAAISNHQDLASSASSHKQGSS